jgi:hypothetical protein
MFTSPPGDRECPGTAKTPILLVGSIGVEYFRVYFASVRAK